MVGFFLQVREGANLRPEVLRRRFQDSIVNVVLPRNHPGVWLLVEALAGKPNGVGRELLWVCSSGQRDHRRRVHSPAQFDAQGNISAKTYSDGVLDSAPELLRSLDRRDVLLAHSLSGNFPEPCGLSGEVLLHPGPTPRR